MSKRTAKDDVGIFHDYGVHLPSRTIYVGSENSSDCATETGEEAGVDHAMAERLIKNLHALDVISQEPITVIMNNPGGFVFHGMAIFSAIKATKSKVRIIVRGQASSMGSLIFQAADERIMSPHAIMMIHHGTDGYESIHTKNVRKWVDFGKKYDKLLNEIYLAKIREKHPLFSMTKLDRLMDFDTILTAREAVDLGLADAVEEPAAKDE